MLTGSLKIDDLAETVYRQLAGHLDKNNEVLTEEWLSTCDRLFSTVQTYSRQKVAGVSRTYLAKLIGFLNYKDTERYRTDLEEVAKNLAELKISYENFCAWFDCLVVIFSDWLKKNESGEKDLVYAWDRLSFQSFAIIASFYFERSREEAWQEVAQLSVLLEIKRVLSSSEPLKRRVGSAARIIARVMNCDFCGIWLWDKMGEKFVPVQIYAQSEELKSSFQKSHLSSNEIPLLMESLQSGMPVLIDDCVLNPFLPKRFTNLLYARSMIIGPLVSSGEFVGMVTAGTTGQYLHFSPNGVALFLGLVNCTAVAIGLDRVFQERLSMEINRKLANQQELVKSERLAAMTKIGAEMSHEINNPLATILGQAQLLLRKSEQLPEGTREQIEVIQDMCIRIRDAMRKLKMI